MRLQSAIFDMDGTLLDSMHVWINMSDHLLRDLGYEPEPDLRDIVKVLTIPDGARYCKEHYRMKESVEELVAMTDARTEDFYRHHVQPKPGVVRFLSLLQMEGVGMYVATNTDRRLAELALSHAGIDSYFRGMVTCGDVGIGKAESPLVFERALARLGGRKESNVVFEDALHCIRTAKAAGFRVCAVYDPSAEDDQEESRALADTYIHSFEEMLEIHPLG